MSEQVRFESGYEESMRGSRVWGRGRAAECLVAHGDEACIGDRELESTGGAESTDGCGHVQEDQICSVRWGLVVQCFEYNEENREVVSVFWGKPVEPLQSRGYVVNCGSLLRGDQKEASCNLMFIFVKMWTRSSRYPKVAHKIKYIGIFQHIMSIVL